jgi:curli production assembly/transport component CsgF
MSPRGFLNNNRLAFVAVLAFAVGLAGAAEAGTLVYTPTNPSFGGNPLNGPTLFNNAQVQNQFNQSAAAGIGSGTLTPGQIFAQQLTSQLYSSLANKITQAIFGESASQQQTGSFSFEGTTISYQRNGSNIDITINDGQTITHVSVPAGP